MPEIADVIALAHTLDGLTADPVRPSCRARYLSTIAPAESEERAAGMATMSGCALVMRGILRAFIAHPFLDSPYVTGHAMSDLVQIAIEARALRIALVPSAGDIVIVGGGADGGGPEHTFMILDATTALDGGQRDAGRHQCIITREHRISRSFDNAPGSPRRRVRFILDTTAILARFGRQG